MTGKTKKELQVENNLLKEEIQELKLENEDLSKKCKKLETKCNETVKKNSSFKCKICEENFENLKSLKKHQNIHKSQKGDFKCADCEKEFDEEWKINAHIKTHKNFKCDKCEKTFKYQDIKTKHMQISHGNSKFYCHFFNNKKTCPYSDKCVFLHEDSKMCRYGALCERNYCMFQHDQNDNESEKIEKEKEDLNFETTLNVEDISKIVDVDDDDEPAEIFEQYDELSNMTFVNPSQDEPIPSNSIFMCDNCDFIAASKAILNNHKQTNHNWCCKCY